MILSTAYLPNIEYVSKFCDGNPLVEAHENFQKQTFRNRAQIMTASGVQTLTVPIIWQRNVPDEQHDSSRKSEHGDETVGRSRKIAIQEVRIDNSTPWQRTHWRALRAAYTSSPYFDHYVDILEPYYLSRRWSHLLELNTVLTEELLRIFKLPVPLVFTDGYEHEVADDFRNSIVPNHGKCSEFVSPEYYQVFADRQPFAANLSIVDYLFCEGPRL